MNKLPSRHQWISGGQRTDRRAVVDSLGLPVEIVSGSSEPAVGADWVMVPGKQRVSTTRSRLPKWDRPQPGMYVSVPCI